MSLETPQHSPAGTVFSVERFAHLLVIAWKRQRAYPAGHPALAGSTERAHEELTGLLAAGGPLALGVARDALLWNEERLDGVGVNQLASYLYRGNVAVLRLGGGVTADELGRLVGCFSAAPGEDETALLERLEASELPHVEVEPVDYSLVVASSDLDEAAERRPQNLWERILSWQLEGRPMVAGGHGEATLDGVLELVRVTLARAGGSLGAEGGLAPEVAELAERIGEAIQAQLDSTAPGPARTTEARQVAQLLSALPAALRAPILDAALGTLAAAGGDAESLAAVTASSSAVEVLRALRRLRDSGQRLPPHAVQLVEKLALTAGDEAAAADRSAAGEPPLQQEELDAALGARPDEPVLELPPPVTPPAEPIEGMEQELDGLSQQALLQRLVQSLLALLAGTSLTGRRADGVAHRLEHAFASLLATGHPSAAYALVLRLESLAGAAATPASAAAGALLERLRGPDNVPRLVQALRRAGDDEGEQLRGLVELLGAGFVRHLLLALGEAEELAVRRTLFQLLQSLPGEVAAQAPALLEDDRWFVVRNAISLLHGIGDRRSLAQIRGCLRHGDARVRLEALKAIAELDRQPPLPLLVELLGDDDEAVARRAAQLLGSLGQRQAVAPLLELLKPIDRQGQRRRLRLQALHSLGQIGDPEALPALRRFFGSFFPVDSVEERRAAFASLAGYPAAAREPWRKKGLRSRDAEIRQLCQRLGTAGERA